MNHIDTNKSKEKENIKLFDINIINRTKNYIKSRVSQTGLNVELQWVCDLRLFKH